MVATTASLQSETALLGDADTNNVTKVIFGQEVGDGNGFSYLVGETVETVHPRGI